MSKSVIFFGTPKIAAKCLQALIDKKINIKAVVTKPDKPVGRHNKIIYSEVKLLAIANKFTLFQPENLKDIIKDLRELNPDMILTCAYGKIIPDEILNIPLLKCVNIHPSLLPKLRGATPIQSAIINNESITGVSFMYMSNKLDAGDILLQQSIKIDNNETYLSLYDKLTDLSYSMIVNHIDELLDNKIKPIKQNDNDATFCKTINREDEKINWNSSAISIDCLVRGLYDKPAAYTKYNNEPIKIFTTKVVNESSSNPGLIKKIDKTGIYVETNDKVIVITSLQLPNKKRMEVFQIINGNHPFKVNTKFN